jgi:hypothetical protein
MANEAAALIDAAGSDQAVVLLADADLGIAHHFEAGQ